MLARLMGKTLRRPVLPETEAANRLLALAEGRGALTLDAAALAELGIGPARARRAAWLLAWREQLHVLAEADGELVLVSNPQFDQITRIRFSLSAARLRARPEIQTVQASEAVQVVQAGEPVSETAAAGAESAKDAAAPDGGPVSAPSALPVPKPEETNGEITAPAGPETEFGWFQLDIGATVEAELARRKSPDTRHILPERGREPWLVREAAVSEDKKIDFGDFS